MKKASFDTSLRQILAAHHISSEPSDLQNYGRDWTKRHAPDPCAIVFPSSPEQVAEILALCQRERQPVVPSGGRTGLSGGAVAAQQELVLSLEKLNQIGSIDSFGATLSVGAGAITAQVHQATEQEGLTWPIDLAAAGSSQIGGNISTNAGGIRVLRYGNTRKWVLSLQVATMEGELLTIGGGGLEKNNTGLDLCQTIIGSEGILAVVTGATLKLAPLSQHRQVILLALDSSRASLDSLRCLRSLPLTLNAFEYFSSECLQVVQKQRKLARPFARDYRGYAVVEFEPQDPSEPMENYLQPLWEAGHAQDLIFAKSKAEQEKLWNYREGISESLAHTGLLHKNDVSVPVSKVADFAEEARALLLSNYPDYGVYIFGHIGDGNLHLNVMKPAELAPELFFQSCHEVDKLVFSLVRKYQGSISAEHGIGLLKKWALKYSRSQTEIVWMRKIKSVFDPHQLLNPGKVF